MRDKKQRQRVLKYAVREEETEDQKIKFIWYTKVKEAHSNIPIATPLWFLKVGMSSR